MQQWNKGIIAWFAHNSVAANLLMAILLIAGLVSAITIRKEVQPKLEIDTITVTVPYLGAAPKEVEEGILIKIEEAVQGVEGIEELRSIALEGSGIVTVDVASGYDVDVVLDHEGDQYTVDMIVNVAGRDNFIAHERGEDTFALIDLIVDKLTRQLRRHKERFRNRKHPTE